MEKIRLLLNCHQIQLLGEHDFFYLVHMKDTGANAGGPRQLSMRTRWAARVARFCRWVMKAIGTSVRFDKVCGWDSLRL
jgi:hypothetical protein